MDTANLRFDSRSILNAKSLEKRFSKRKTAIARMNFDSQERRLAAEATA
jgi:hypothetical protein